MSEEVIKLRITADGTVRGLWSDAVDWPAIGVSAVRRASHVEHCRQRQEWYVQRARPCCGWRRLLQGILRQAFGEVLYRSPSRKAALSWEHVHLSPGGPENPES